jgi:hypothetical protein
LFNSSVLLGQNFTQEKNFIFPGVRTNGILKVSLAVVKDITYDENSYYDYSQRNSNRTFQSPKKRDSKRRSRSNKKPSIRYSKMSQDSFRNRVGVASKQPASLEVFRKK